MLVDEFWDDPIDLVHRLADNLNIAYDCILDLFIVLESFKIWQRLKVAGRALDSLCNVPKVVFDAFRVRHKGRA